MDVHRRPGEIDVHVFIALVFALDVALGFSDARLGVLLDAGNGVVFIAYSFSLPFLAAGGRGAVTQLFQSV